MFTLEKSAIKRTMVSSHFIASVSVALQVGINTASKNTNSPGKNTHPQKKL